MGLESEAEEALSDVSLSDIAAALEDTESSATSAVESAASALSDSLDALLIENYAAFAEAEVDTPVIVGGYVQAKQALKDGTVSMFIEDEDGCSYFIYAMPCTEEEYEKLTEGQAVMVTGFKGEWSGEVEIVDAELEILEDEDTYVAEAEDVTDLLGSDELIDDINSKVAFKNLTVAGIEDPDNGDELVAYLYNWDGSGTEGDDLYFAVENDEGTYLFTVESDLCDKDSDVYKAVENLKVGDVIDVEGFLYWYEGPQPHITSVEVVGSAEAVESEAAESEAVESEAVESEAVESEAAESEAVESETAALEAVESEAAELESVVSEIEDAAAKVVAALGGK